MLLLTVRSSRCLQPAMIPLFRTVWRHVSIILALALVVAGGNAPRCHAATYQHYAQATGGILTTTYLHGGEIVQTPQQGVDLRQQTTVFPAEVTQNPEEGRLPLLPAGPVESKGSTAANQENPYLGLAWQEFSRRNYRSAASIFSFLAKDQAVRLEATYGLALCHAKLKQTGKAIQLLKELAARKPQYKETLPTLVSLLVEQGLFEQAGEYARKLGGQRQKRLLEDIEAGIFRQKIRDAGRSRDTSAIRRLIRERQAELRQCRMTDAFYESAGILAEGGERDEAIALYRALLACGISPDLRIGVFYRLKPLIPAAELLAMLDSEKKRAAMPPGYPGKVRTMMLEVLHGILQTGPDNLGEVAEAILRLNPGDPAALSARAWWHFNNGRFDDAYGDFSQLHTRYPVRVDYVSGMIYALIKLKRYDEALALATSYGNDESIAPLVREIRLTALWDRVNATSSESPEIETLAREILAINPDDDNIRLVLAWWYFRSDNYEAAAAEFGKLYEKNPQEKDHSYGLAISLEQLGRIDEAIAIAEKHRAEDPRSASLLAGMYYDKAREAIKEKKYREAERYAEGALANNPEDQGIRETLDLSRYKQTSFSRIMSAIAGLSGSSYGSVTQDIKGSTGLAVSGWIKQGIDWFRLPGDILFSTYGEYKHSARTGDKRYFDESGYGVGAEFKKGIFTFGGEYFWDTYTQQQTTLTRPLYLTWYHDWTKRIWFEDEEHAWIKMNALSGSTYGKITHDFSGLTGTGVSGYLNQGIDWFTLPGGITFNTYGEYRFGFRTKDTLYYNAHGPAVGFEFQRKPFTLGFNAYWQLYPERSLMDRQIGAYLRWYLDWDLKPERDR
jgi:tetratricopeptide (TPR) repeat protein